MQGPPGGGGWNPGGGPPGGGGWSPGGPGAPSQPATPSQPGTPARTVALSAAELASAQGGTPPPAAGQYAAPAPGFGAPMAHAQAHVMAQPIEAKPVATNVGLFVGLALFALGTLSCLGTGAAAALLRERDAVMVSYLTVPLIFGGLIAPIVGLATRGQSAPVSGGAAGGCGCLTMVVAAVGVVVFYQAIWPSL